MRVYKCCRSQYPGPSRVRQLPPSPAFYSIGALFAVYGAGILFISLFRRQQGQLTVMVQMYDDDAGVAADNR
jgi:hypothetical protein